MTLDKTLWRVIELENAPIIHIWTEPSGIRITLEGKDQRYSIRYNWLVLLNALRNATWHHLK